MHGFIQKVHRQIRTLRLAEPGHDVVAATSGGADSVAMACALAALPGLNLGLAYVDHGTRPETALERDFVGALAERLGVAFHSLTCAPTSRSEAALRDSRYAALEGLQADRIATGHTADDQAETVLLRIARGAGVVGLAGIPPRRGRFIRPLLGLRRADALAYLSDIEQAHCVDPSNATLGPTRNRVRHVVLPLLREQLQPGVDLALCRLAAAARSDRAFIEDAAAEHLAEHGLALTALRAAHPGLRPHIVRAACPVGVDAERMAAILDLTDAGSGAVQLEGGLTVVIGTEGQVRSLAFRPTGARG